MRLHTLSPIVSALAVSSALVSASPALAEMVKMTATLDGAQQVPPVESPAMALRTSPSTPKPKSSTGRSSIPASPKRRLPAISTVRPTRASMPMWRCRSRGRSTSPIKGSATLTDAQAADLMAGKYYINIHTPAHPGGEIRGQVEKAM